MIVGAFFMARVALDIVSALVNEEPDKVYVACIILNCDSRNIVSLSLPEVKFIPVRFKTDSHGPEVKVPPTRSDCSDATRFENRRATPTADCQKSQ